MVKTKLWPTADPCCGHPNKHMGHILQCPHPDAQLILWDTEIWQLHKHLCNNETEPGLIEDLSSHWDHAWRRKELQPLAITSARQAQANLTWQNLVDSFLSTDWKIQQATYYTNQQNPSLATTWAADLIWLILKYAHQQWDHWNQVLHQLQADWVTDLVLDIEIWQQYDRGWASLPPASQMLLNRPLLITLGLPYNEKHQWLTSIKATCQQQHSARARIAMAQHCLRCRWSRHLGCWE